MNKIIGIFVVILLIITIVLPIVNSEYENVSIELSNEMYAYDRGDGDVERWAIAMGFSFDGISNIMVNVY